MKRVIRLNNISMFYQVYGRGNQNILLLHGWGQSHAFWNDIIKPLRRKYHIYVLDLPGFGLSQEPPYTWSIEEYAEHIYKFLTAVCGLNPIIMGHSFGGRIAIAYASKFTVKKLILYSTGGGLPERSLLKKLHKDVFVKIGKYICPNFIYKCYAMFFKPKHYQNKVIVNKKRSRRMLDIYSQRSQNLTQVLESITAKTLVIIGQKDCIIEPAIGRKLHKIMRNSILVEIPKATHFAHLESPKTFYSALAKFLTTPLFEPIEIANPIVLPSKDAS